jgi:hypothetical protein
MNDSYGNPMPRRCFVDRMTLAELDIRDAIHTVEDLGCDARLTEAINLLAKAKDLVADFVDEKYPGL